MRKFSPSAAHIDAARGRPEEFREVCVPLYLPAPDARGLSAPRRIDVEELMVDASGITIGGDEEDDDFY
ncbi:MAG TPA: hypothetical protein VGN80_13075 [Devosiaceae bacterium]|jgi:hypothetical protein|nr:hypothetical protein [Devosiaceae bacterium]